MPTDREIIDELTQLMAFYRVKLTITGECGDVEAQLLVWPTFFDPPDVVADLKGMADPQDVFSTLLGYVDAWRLRCEKSGDPEEDG